MMIEIKNGNLFIQEKESKNKKKYYALYLNVNEEVSIFITFINKSIFDKLNK